MITRPRTTGQSDTNSLFDMNRGRYPLPSRRFLGITGLLLVALAAPVNAAVTTYYGVQAQLWKPVNGLMKMDYDWTYSRFHVQYNYGYGWGPPQYATIDLATKTLTHFATTSGADWETLFTVLPTSWGSVPANTMLVPQGGGGAVLAIDPFGNVSTFASGLPGGGAGPTNYSTARINPNFDLIYANEGTGHVIRIDSTGSPVWSTVVPRRDGLVGRPEAVITLGTNPRWGTYQNSILIGENDVTTNIWQLDYATGAVGFPSPDLGAALGRTAETFRIYHNNLALYLSIHNGPNSTIWQLTNLAAIPNVQDGDLFVAVEQLFGGQVWHVYFDPLGNLVTQKIVEITGDGFLEDMVFAPVPEPGTAAGLLLGALFLTLRRR
jgi:hypothetical protein